MKSFSERKGELVSKKSHSEYYAQTPFPEKLEDNLDLAQFRGFGCWFVRGKK